MAFRKVSFPAFAAALSLFVLSPLHSVASTEAAQDEGPKPIQVVVRAQAKGDAVPTLTPKDVKIEFNGKQTPATVLQPIGGRNGAPLEVALLIDDGLRSNFGTQISELEQFVRNTAGPGVALGVGYMQNGVARFPVGFSTDPEQELKAIRLPMAVAGIDGSPYFCLQDLVRKWPVHQGAARVVIMITSGIDRYNGSVSPMNQNSPYVDAAMKDAQRAGIPVYSIFYGRREVNPGYGAFSGQSYLQQVADGTGGEAMNMGSINPVSLTPYFKQFQKALSESYLLQFQTNSSRLQTLRIKSGVSGVKIKVQTDAGVAGAK